MPSRQDGSCSAGRVPLVAAVAGGFGNNCYARTYIPTRLPDHSNLWVLLSAWFDRIEGTHHRADRSGDSAPNCYFAVCVEASESERNNRGKPKNIPFELLPTRYLDHSLGNSIPGGPCQCLWTRGKCCDEFLFRLGHGNLVLVRDLVGRMFCSSNDAFCPVWCNYSDSANFNHRSNCCYHKLYDDGGTTAGNRGGERRPQRENYRKGISVNHGSSSSNGG